LNNRDIEKVTAGQNEPGTTRKLGRYVWIWIVNKCAKFHAKRLSGSETSVKSFRGYFIL